MARARLHLLFAAVGVGCFPVATVGFDFVARIVVAHEPLGVAASNSVRFIGDPWWFTFLMLLPFLCAAFLSAEVTRVASARIGRNFFVVLLAVLALIYFFAYWAAQTALLEGKWTAASLSVVMVPFSSITVIALAAIASIFVARRHRHRET